MKKVYNIEVDCINCANGMQEELKKCDGIKDASVNFFAKKVEITFEDGVDIDSTIKKARDYIKDQDDELEIYI